tara:strand:- start:1778 stop:1927 length:150 start_codon:yes stop_codon:yes gene_type:complete
MEKTKLDKNTTLARHGDSAMMRKFSKVKKSTLAKKESRKVKSDLRNYIW